MVRPGSLGYARRITVVVVSGGYNPQHIEAIAGVPLQIVFDPQESGAPAGLDWDTYQKLWTLVDDAQNVGQSGRDRSHPA